jgi:DNA primase
MELSAFVTACHETLLSGGEASKKALDYLTAERGMSAESLKEHQMGFCPHGHELPGSFGDRSVNERLHGKIVVPIFGEFGKCVGVAARCPDKESKGWWNSRFDKEHHLYMFNLSRKSVFERNRCYVFEGYVDAVMLRQYGLLNSVAMMGTSLGYRRIGLLARYCDELCLCFDNDPNDAGLMGQLKTMADLWSLGFGRVTKVILPQKVDPDEFVVKRGLKEFLALEEKVPDCEMKNARRSWEELKAKRRLEQEEKR